MVLVVHSQKGMVLVVHSQMAFMGVSATWDSFKAFWEMWDRNIQCPTATARHHRYRLVDWPVWHCSVSGYINVGCGGKAGYYFSSTCVLVGSLTLFFIDLHRWNLARHKHTRANGTQHLCVSETCPQRRRLSFSQEPDNNDPGGGNMAAPVVALGPGIVADPAAGVPLPVELLGGAGNLLLATGDKPELTCISEEGIADMDLPDNLLDDLDYIGDCITSCNKVMLDYVTCLVITWHHVTT